MSFRQTGNLDYSKSPYYLSLFPFQRRTFPAVYKPQVSKEALFSHNVRDIHNSPPLTLQSKEVTKPLKAGQSSLNVHSPLQGPDRISAIRLHLKNVSLKQLETAKQQNREAAIKALLLKRREIIGKRAVNAQKIALSRSELLEEKRVMGI